MKQEKPLVQSNDLAIGEAQSEDISVIAALAARILRDASPIK